MVIMIDAFRYDYVERPELVGFRKFLSSGSRSRFVEPVFPSKTYPNMFTQVTGMYTESHGVVDNNMYDPDQDELFFASGVPSGTTHKVDAEGKHSFWWNQSEPIWITAERNGLRSGIYYWEGCQTEIHRVNVTFCFPYKSLVSMDLLDYETHYDEVIRDSLLNLKNDTWDLAMIYYELVDATGHANYIDTAAFRNALMITDNIILKLLTLIELNGLKDIVNVILVSDHGMTFRQQSDLTYIVNLTDYLRDWHDCDPYLGSGTIVQLFPKPEVYKEVYKNLTRTRIPGMKVYAKAELPRRFGIKRNRRTAPILLVAETGHNINNFGAGWVEHGLHGFDPANNPEMRAIFAGTGPAFKSGFVSRESMIMTDHFNIFCHVLQISCHANNGSIDRVEDMFRNPVSRPHRISENQSTKTEHSVSTLLFTLIAAVFH
jgi:predicted AlkP superfamily pyrophosphatase or phosphodiesterase